MPVPLARLVRVGGVEVGDDDPEHVGRRGQEQRNDISVAAPAVEGVYLDRVDDRREEIGDSTAGDDAEEEDQLRYG